MRSEEWMMIYRRIGCCNMRKMEGNAAWWLLVCIRNEAEKHSLLSPKDVFSVVYSILFMSCITFLQRIICKHKGVNEERMPRLNLLRANGRRLHRYSVVITKSREIRFLTEPRQWIQKHSNLLGSPFHSLGSPTCSSSLPSLQISLVYPARSYVPYQHESLVFCSWFSP